MLAIRHGDLFTGVLERGIEEEPSRGNLDNFSHRLTSFEHRVAIGVYRLIHQKTGKIYIGSTASLYHRAHEHGHDLRTGKHGNKALQEAYNEDPRFELMFVRLADRDQAYQEEQRLLDQYKDSGLLFNVALDARSANKGRLTSEATKQLLSAAQMGHVVTEETRQKLRLSNAGQIVSLEQRAKLSVSVNANAVVQSKRKAVIVHGQRYDGLRIAAKVLGLDNCTLRHRVLSDRETWKEYRYADD